jgi:hypothetical protein
MFYTSARPRASEGHVTIAIIAIFMVLVGRLTDCNRYDDARRSVDPRYGILSSSEERVAQLYYL